MKNFFELLDNNPLGILEGRFRSSLMASEFDEEQSYFNADNLIISFEKEDLIIGKIKGLEYSKIEYFDTNREVVEMVMFDPNFNGNTVHVKMKFKYEGSGTFFAVLQDNKWREK